MRRTEPEIVSSAAPMVDDEDIFWKVAFVQNESRTASDFEEEDRDSPDTSVHQARDFVLKYQSTTLHLRLEFLAKGSGAWSPLGASPWYGSALLTAILLDTKSPNNRIHQHLSRNDYTVDALELGSGAVGLSGIALGLLLTVNSSITLSDNDSSCLKQLEVNMTRNTGKDARLEGQNPNELPKYDVQPLDWSNEDHVVGLNSIQLIIGSELVYTQQTGEACLCIVRSFIRRNCNILIVVVQIADRNGWDSVFLEGLRAEEAVAVEIERPSREHHATASSWVVPGGTLNVESDYEIAYISKCCI